MTKLANFKSKKFFSKGESPKLTRTLGHECLSGLELYLMYCIATISKFANFKSKWFFKKKVKKRIRFFCRI